jgi:site-specific recombinase XerC
MQEELQRRNYSDITAVCYLRHVAEFARHFGRSPDLLGAEEIKQFQLHLIQKRKVSWATYIQAMAALRFLYVKTLGLTFMAGKIPYPRRPKLLPTVLSQEEVSRLLDGTRSLKHRVLLMTLYGGGLRVSEACRLTLADIDSSRKPRDAKIGCHAFTLSVTTAASRTRGTDTSRSSRVARATCTNMSRPSSNVSYWTLLKSPTVNHRSMYIQGISAEC